MIPAPILLIGGLIGLILGSELAVRSARSIASQLGLSSLVVGLTVASVGTSVPEIATNVMVGVNSLAGTDASGVAVGNILGSCLSQVTLLLGIAALARGLKAQIVRADVIAVVLAIVAAALASFDGVVQRAEGVALVCGYIVYLVLVYQRKREQVASDEVVSQTPLGVDVALGVLALVVVSASAQGVVSGATSLATAWGLSETTLGVLVGVGTGLPELAVALSAVRQRDDGIAVGNLIGSNITDPLLSFGLGSIVHPVTVPVTELLTDFFFWVGGTVIALLLLSTGRELDRQEAAVLLVVFALYLSMRILN